MEVSGIRRGSGYPEPIPEHVRSTLILVAFVITDPEPELLEGEFDETRPEKNLTNQVAGFLQSHGPQLEMIAQTSAQLPTSTSARCTHCGAWATDSWREDVGLHAQFHSPGTFYGSEMLCAVCLSEVHPLHF